MPEQLRVDKLGNTQTDRQVDEQTDQRSVCLKYDLTNKLISNPPMHAKVTVHT